MTRILEPEIPQLFGNELANKRRSFLVSAGTDVALKTAILKDGEVLKLGNDNYSYVARFAEAISRRIPSETVENLTADGDGYIVINVPQKIISTPAIYELSVAAKNKETDGIEYTTDYLIYLEPTVWIDEKYRNWGPPPYQRLKTRLRDSDLLENELTHYYQFQLTDICEAAIEAIEEFNCAPPKIAALSVTTGNFQDFDTFMLGIETCLFRNLLEHYRKNSLRYAAAGLQIDDNKIQEYMQAYAERKQEYMQQIMRIKIQANYGRAWGITTGLYRWRY